MLIPGVFTVPTLEGPGQVPVYPDLVPVDLHTYAMMQSDLGIPVTSMQPSLGLPFIRSRLESRQSIEPNRESDKVPYYQGMTLCRLLTFMLSRSMSIIQLVLVRSVIRKADKEPYFPVVPVPVPDLT